MPQLGVVLEISKQEVGRALGSDATLEVITGALGKGSTKIIIFKWDVFEEIQCDRNDFPQPTEIRFRNSSTYQGSGKSAFLPRDVCARQVYMCMKGRL